MVHHYRVYRLDRANHVADVAWITAESDQEALASARAMKHGSKRELWLGDRLVGTIEAPLPGEPSGAFWL